MSQEETKSDEQRAWESTPDLVVLAIEQQAQRLYGDERLDRARELYEKLVKMRPRGSQYWAMLGVIHRRQGHLVRALKALERAVDIQPENRNALVNFGEALVLAGKPEEGAQILRAVFDMGYDPDKEAKDHDVITKRAGAQLAVLHEIAQGVLSGEITREDLEGA